MKFWVLPTAYEKVSILFTKKEGERLQLSVFLSEETFENMASEKDSMYARIKIKFL